MNRLFLALALAIALFASGLVLLGADDSDAYIDFWDDDETINYVHDDEYPEGWVAVRYVKGGVSDLTVPSTVTYDGTTYLVKIIELGGQHDLVNVTLSDGIEEIGIGYGFWHCENLKSVSIPDSVTTIGCDAFNGCHSLYSLYLPDSVTTIEGGALGDSGLTYVRLPENESFTELPEDLFKDCQYLSYVAIPSNITSIGKSCFVGCDRLQQIVIPENVKHIGEYAFDDCRSLTFIDLRCDETTVFEHNSLYGSSVLDGSMVKVRTSLSRDLLYNDDVWAIRDNAQIGPGLEFGYHLHGNTMGRELSNHEWDLVNGHLKVWAVSQENTVLPDSYDLFYVVDSDGYSGGISDLVMYVEFVDDPSHGKYLLTSTGTNSFYNWFNPYYVLPEGMTQFDWDSIENPFIAKVPDTAVSAPDTWESGNAIIVSDSHVTDSLRIDAPSVIMGMGTAIKSNGLLRNFSAHHESGGVLFLSGSTAMVGKINTAGLTGDDINVTYLSDTNGKVYWYDCDQEKWVRASGLRTVEFNLNDGSGLLTRKIVTDTVGEAGVSFVPDRTFAGWFDAASGGSFVPPDSSASSDLTRLYAHWDGALVVLGSGVTLTVDGVDYTGLATVPLDGTATVSFDEGYALYYAPGFAVSGSVLVPVAKCSTYAVMAKPVGSTFVTLDLAGGEGEFTSYRAYVGSAMDSDFQAPARTGYTFDGYTNAAGKRVITTSGVYARSVSGYTDSNRLWTNENSSVTLTAKWVAHTTQVTFHNMGVVDDVVRTATYGQEFPFVDSPASPDARFEGYYDAVTADGKASGSLVIRKDHRSAEAGSQYFDGIYDWAGDIASYDLYAKWVPKYTLVNDVDGFRYELSGDEVKEIGNAPTRAGYDFAGWLLSGDVDYSTAVYGTEGNVASHIADGAVFAVEGSSIYVGSLSSTVSGEVHMVPQWTPINYNVGFDLDGGSGSFSDKTWTFDTKYTVAEPAKEGYTFLGWTVSGDATGWAEYSDTKNGTYHAMSSTTPAKNSTAGKAIYVRNLSTDASKKTTLVANWTPGSYTLRFDANAADAAGYMDIQTIYIGTTANITLNAYDRVGHSFSGWATDPVGPAVYANGQAVTNIAPKDSVLTLYAVWQVNQYTIHFTNTGASYIDDITQDFGTVVNAPANPVLPRYTFVGWSPQIPSTMPAQDMTITAQWVVDTYEVTFNANGGSGTMGKQSIAYEQSVALSPNAYTRTGYLFSSWNTAKDGSGTSYGDKEPVLNLGDATLYAQWTPIKYTVRFHSNAGADATVNQTMTYGKSAALKANTFSNAPYSFDSWNTKANGTGTSYADKATVKNLAKASGAVVHLYAQWDAPVTAITLDKGAGTTSGYATAKYGSASAVITVEPTGETRLAGYYDGDVLVINADGTFPADAGSYVSNGVWAYTGETLTLTALWKDPYEVGDRFVSDNILFEITSVSPKTVVAIDVDQPSDEITIPSIVGYMGADFSVSAIAAGGFPDCTTMTFLKIPASVSYIGPRAFYGVTFYEADKVTVLAKTAAELSGYQYFGSEAKLAREGAEIGDKFTYGPLKYMVTSVEPYKAQVVGYEGVMKNLEVPFYATYKGIDFAVTSIGKEAFYSCSTMVTASLGNVSEVGVKAFANCTKLKTVDVGESLKTISAYGFYRCVNMVNVDISDSAKTLRNIGHYAFYKDTDLASISIPSYVTTLSSDHTFSFEFVDEDGAALEMNAESLKGYRYDRVDGKMVRDAGIKIGDEYSLGNLKYKVISVVPAELEISAYTGTVKSLVVPETLVFDDCEFAVTAIGENAFNGCNSLRTADLGHVDTVKKQAFYACKYLTTVKMPDVTAIGIKAFANCVKLTDPGFGERLKTISAYGFYQCKVLEAADLPDTVRSVGSYAFYKCYKLADVDFGASLKTIGSYAFTQTALTKAVLPESIRKVGSYAFSSCSELKELVIGGESTKIMHKVLDSSPAVEMIVMPAAIGKMYSDSFDGYAFAKADGTILKQTAKNLKGHAFVGTDGVMILKDTFTVTFEAQPDGSASFARPSLEVAYGAPIVVSDLDLYVDNEIVLLQPAAGYVQVGWDAPEKVDGDVTVRALFEAA